MHKAGLRSTSLPLTLLLPAAGVLLAISSLASAQNGPFDLPDDHFMCYRGKVIRGDLILPSGLQPSLTDEFETSKVHDVRKPAGICTPANKNGEGIKDFNTHLTPYRISAAAGEPRHVRQVGIRVFNQFGNLVVDTLKESRLLLPAHKNASGGPVTAPVGSNHNVDHYKCYTAKRSKGSAKLARGLQVTVEDQFEAPAKIYNVRKPRLLCNPVDKNGEGIKNPDGHMMCYTVKPASSQPKHVRRRGISTADQFVIHKMDTRQEEFLCVPSLTNPPAEFCGDGEVNQPPFEDCDGDASACNPGETCAQTCECLSALGQRTFSLDPNDSSFLSNFLGQAPVGTPSGTLVLDGGPIDGTNSSPISLVAPPYYIGVDINLGAPMTLCNQFLSCTGIIHCSGGFNVDVVDSLDSLSPLELGCIADGTNFCTDDPTSVCCSNSCEGIGVGSGNTSVVTTGVGAGDSGPGAMVMTCQVRTVNDLPLGSDCAVQDYSSSPIETRGLTTGTATAAIPQHCAGPGGPPEALLTFAATGVNFDCGSWTTEDSPGTIVWGLPAEEPTPFLPGDGANAFIYAD